MGSATFNYTGGWQVFTVPAGVTSLSCVLNGAGSGSVHGGEVRGRLAVTGGQKLYLVIGGVGRSNSGTTAGAGSWGAGGNGGNGYNASGGDGGGGYTGIRKGSTSGTIVAIAGGAGGTSGDGGTGGVGGGSTAGSGHRGSAGSGATGAATGGTQTQGGNAGTSSSGSQFNGTGASDTALARAGSGGDTGGYDGPGGGGGGGGYRSGGGGQGGSSGWAPGGGGGGGSNYYAGLTSASSTQGAGNLGAGNLSFTWSDPAPANGRPNTPGSLTPASGTRLKANSVTLAATLSDPNLNSVRMRVLFSTHSDMSSASVHYSGYVASGHRATLTVPLSASTHYYIRAYAQDSHGQTSLGYAASNFFSNYPPDAPVLVSPANGSQSSGLSSIVFHWTAVDPDSQPASAWQIQFYDETSAATTTKQFSGSTSTYTSDPAQFKSNRFYLWRVRTRDPLGIWGAWSEQFRFFITGTSTAPLLLSPIKDAALDVGNDNTFRWKFRDPDQGDAQSKADLRYKVVGTDDSSWVVLLGDNSIPGTSQFWSLRAHTFLAGFHYEWQVRTYDTLSGGLTPSDWTNSATFYSIPPVGSAVDLTLPDSNEYTGALGVGYNEAYLAVKGGHIQLGQLTPATSIDWGRTRDDISTATVILPIANNTVCELASQARCWQHEVVVYRTVDGVKRRAWEGPITRIAYHPDHVEIEARDVMGWVYRRIMKQGYSDAYPNTYSVVKRASRIIQNALAIDDPNILKYLTLIEYPDDAKQSRVRADWASTAWEEVDDLAANAGLDYTVVGRRILLWDTSRPIGKLPVLRSKDFADPPIVTEYGMLYANLYGVTNNAGVFGSASRSTAFTGPIELLAAAYGEQATGTDETLTAAAKLALVKVFNAQAERGIAHRYPAPLVVRVPDNTTLRPNAPISLDHLIPGVWIPLQAEHTCRSFSQWQKLDSMKVTQTAEGESIQVTMGPAPNSGEDPDADAAAVEDGN